MINLTKMLIKGELIMILKDFLKRYNRQPEDVLKQIGLTETQMNTRQVIHYPDELLYVLAKEVNEDISVILYELLNLENPGNVRRAASDYSLFKAIENEARYIFIPQAYRKEQSKLLTDLLIEFDIFELELGPIAKYNFIGKKIYEVFLASTGKGEEFKKIENKLPDYFVLVHDDSGSLLAASL